MVNSTSKYVHVMVLEYMTKVTQQDTYQRTTTTTTSTQYICVTTLFAL